MARYCRNIMAEKENLAGENNEKPKIQKTSTNLTNIIIIIALVGVFAILVGQPALTGNASLCIVTNPGQQSVQEVSEREPYTVYKDVEEPFNYNIVSHYDGYVTYNYVNKKYGKLEIKNTEDHSGIFTVKSIFTDGEKKTEQVLSYDISPETIRLFYFEYYDQYRDTDGAMFAYEVIPPTKKTNMAVTEYRDVTKTKNVAVGKEVSCL